MYPLNLHQLNVSIGLEFSPTVHMNFSVFFSLNSLRVCVYSFVHLHKHLSKNIREQKNGMPHILVCLEWSGLVHKKWCESWNYSAPMHVKICQFKNNVGFLR